MRVAIGPTSVSGKGPSGNSARNAARPAPGRCRGRRTSPLGVRPPWRSSPPSCRPAVPPCTSSDASRWMKGPARHRRDGRHLRDRAGEGRRAALFEHRDRAAPRQLAHVTSRRRGRCRHHRLVGRRPRSSHGKVERKSAREYYYRCHQTLKYDDQVNPPTKRIAMPSSIDASTPTSAESPRLLAQPIRTHLREVIHAARPDVVEL